jgi:hypothetical protein
MIPPIVNELPRRSEPVTRDPFVDGMPLPGEREPGVLTVRLVGDPKTASRLNAGGGAP